MEIGSADHAKTLLRFRSALPAEMVMASLQNGASWRSVVIRMAEGDLKKEGWSAENLGDESSYEDETEIKRRLRRGDETAGDPDSRDVAGAIPEEDTPHGREIRDRAQKSAEEEPTDEQSDKEVP